MKGIKMTDELMHYGQPRRSGRYPWGSGENPRAWLEYFGIKKNKSGSSSSSSNSKSIGTISKSSGGKESSSSKIEKETAKKKEQIVETDEEKKERLIKEQDLREIYNNKELFSTKEITDVINRVNAEANLKKMADAKSSSAFKKGVEFLKSANDATTTVLNAYDNYKKVKKILSKDSKQDDDSKNSKGKNEKKGDGKSKKEKAQEALTMAEEVKQIVSTIRPLLEDKSKK